MGEGRGEGGCIGGGVERGWRSVGGGCLVGGGGWGVRVGWFGEGRGGVGGWRGAGGSRRLARGLMEGGEGGEGGFVRLREGELGEGGGS